MNLDNTPTCNISECLNDAAELLNLPYSKVEFMAFDECIYPQGYNVSMDSSDKDDEDEPLSNAIRQLMRNQGIKEMYLVEED